MRIFDEFGSLYTNQNDPRFTAMIDAGIYVELGELPSFQKTVPESGQHGLFSQNQPQDAAESRLSDNTNTPKL